MKSSLYVEEERDMGGKSGSSNSKDIFGDMSKGNSVCPVVGPIQTSLPHWRVEQLRDGLRRRECLYV